MTDRDAIITRIESAMYESLDPHANYEGFSFDQLSAAVLAEIETTHVLVPRPETMLPLTRANLVIATLRETLQGEEFGRDVSIDTIVTAFMTALVREFASDTTETP